MGFLSRERARRRAPSIRRRRIGAGITFLSVLSCRMSAEIRHGACCRCSSTNARSAGLLARPSPALCRIGTAQVLAYSVIAP